ncbi:MAG: hypothetical protein ABIX10_06140, partial [Acidimicrobiales bacterium]
TAPPPPPAAPDGLPPELPDDDAESIDLSGGEGIDAAPMPPVTGDVSTPPPGAGEVDLGDDGVPVAPATVDAEAQSPVPAMGNQSPVPQMGTIPADGEIDLGTGGAPMPPVGGDVDTAPPGAEDPTNTEVVLPTDTEVELPTAEPQPEIVEEDESTLMAVEPGQERISAAALTGALLDELDMDDPARERMIGLLAEQAADGTITVDELYAAFDAAGFEDTPTDGTATTVQTVLDTGDDLPRTAVVRIDGEGVGVFRIRSHGDVVELESLQTGSVYVAEPRDVEQAWRDSGSRVLMAPAAAVSAAPIEAPVGAPEATPAAEEAESGNGMRNVLVAGAVLLPLAGGATFLATRKIR